MEEWTYGTKIWNWLLVKLRSPKHNQLCRLHNTSGYVFGMPQFKDRIETPFTEKGFVDPPQLRKLRKS